MKWGLPILWSIPLELGVSEVMVWAESKFSSKLFWSLLLGNQWWNGIQPIDIGNKKGIWAAEVRISPAIGIFMWHPGTPNRHHSHFWSSWGRLFNSSHSCRIFEIFACRQCEVTSGKSNFSLAESRDDSTSSFFWHFQEPSGMGETPKLVSTTSWEADDFPPWLDWLKGKSTVDTYIFYGEKPMGIL